MTLAGPTPLWLDPPPEGEPVLRHDPAFVAWDRGLSAARDVVNLGIRALNQAGAGLDELPDGSLEELLVVPLTGDHQVIRQNAVACHQVAEALGTWTSNLGRLALAVDPRWSGRAASAYLLRLGACSAAARALGELVGEGAVIFDEVAEFSERLAVEVEELVVELGETLARLTRKLLARVAGPGGWALLGAELVTQGLDAVADILDDVRRVLALIDTLLGLQESVAQWAQAQRERLQVLRGLQDLVRATI